MRCYSVVLFILLSAPGLADTFVVTKTTDDNGPCTPDDCALREAIIAANDAYEYGAIIEIPGGVYQLSIPRAGARDDKTGSLYVRVPTALRGDPFSEVIIRGDGTDVVIEIGTTTNVLLSHLVITGGGFGGVCLSGAAITIESCTIRGNKAKDLGGFFGGVGGGINLGNARQVTIINSAIYDNEAEGLGGGIVLPSGVGPLDTSHLTLISSTVSHNRARDLGGGIFVMSRSRVDVVNSTIAGNQAPVADGIYLEGLGSAVNSLIEGQCGPAGRRLTSLGGNLESPGDTCLEAGPEDQVAVSDALLAPLADYGGPTPTHALLPGSPAIDAALDADCPTVDQRGVARPLDGDLDGTATCDVGAYEAVAVLPATVEIPTLSEIGFALLLLGLAFAGLWLLRNQIQEPQNLGI